MRLTDLEPHFLLFEAGWESKTFRMTDELAGAHGVEFLCPKCFQANGGRVGTHVVICWTPQVPQTESPTPGRWELVGTGYQDLTLRAGSSSVFLPGPGCGAHFFITKGEITFA